MSRHHNDLWQYMQAHTWCSYFLVRFNLVSYENLSSIGQYQKNKQNSLPTGKLTYLKAVITGETSNGYVLIKIPLVVGLKWLNICISDSEVNITPLLIKVCDLCRMVNKEARTVARNDLDFLISLAHFSEMYFSSWLHRCTFRNKERRPYPQDRMLHPNRNGLRKGFGNQRISKAA